jgi:hypothetical protein
MVGEKDAAQKTWPKNGRALSNALRRLAPTLRAAADYSPAGRTCFVQSRR